MLGEFCTVVTAKKLSRENFVPNVRQSWGSPTGHQAPPVWRVPEGPVWRAGAGFEAQSLAAVPVDNGAWPQYPQTTGVPSPSKFRMQFPHRTNRCTSKNRRISTIRFQHLKYTQGNCMRNYGAGGAWPRHPWVARGLAAVPVGGDRAWPDIEPTRRAKLACSDLAGGPPPTGTPSSPAQRAARPNGRAAAHEHTRPHWCGGCRRDRRVRAGFEARHRTK